MSDNTADALSRVSHQVTTLTQKANRSPRQIPRELVEDALHLHDGNVSLAAKELKTSYTNLAGMVDKDYTLQEICQSYRQELVDLAERNLRASLEEGGLKATFFALTRLGKDRGYAERKEVDTTVTQRQSMDLSKLSTEQLIRMRDMMTDAGVMIDITPESGD